MRPRGDVALSTPKSSGTLRRRSTARGRASGGGYFWYLFPVLSFMFLVTLLPVLYLVVTSFTPLTLTQPSTIGDFSTPLKNYTLLFSDTRLHESVWTQVKLSVFTVSFARKLLR